MDIDLERSEAFSVSLISSTQKPPPPPWNTTATLEELTLDSNFAWLLCALFFAISWVVYITYYNSRIIGFIITKILNRIYPNGCIKIGSFCISVLSGKIMFRDVAFINEDFTIRAQDGWLIFCWWKPYFKKDIADDLSHCETRLSVLLNGLELHVYNRSQLYSRLEKLFGLESKLIKTAATNCVAKSSSKVPSSGNAENGTDAGDILESQQNDDISHFDWKDLVPVVKLEISMGRLVFGNRLLPTTLSVSFEEAIIVYTSKPASSRLDLFTHICKCTGENFKVLLAPSPKYTGMTDEPPRYMGEGFVVLQSNFVDLYYYQDEPGKVAATLETVRMANGDIVQKTTHPLWGLDIKCGKGTDFSYGPWADRQREQLFKFFFPQEYQTLKPTEELKLGELRRPQTFDLRLNTLADATVDILFSKEKETNAIHMNVGPGSYLEATIPWLVKENGYKSRVCGQLLHLDASTSLQYRSLVESETLQFDVEVHYPLHWSDQQDWQCTLTGCKTTVHLIYSHKVFFQALMEDWASKSRPDILRFVPYTWHFSLILKEFELILVTNEHNWIDCSSQLQENAQLAICGELFDLSFDLPFVEFLPPIVSLKFWIQGECVALSAHIPEANPCKTSVLIMEEFAKLCNRDGSLKRSSLDNEKKWRNITTKSSGWVECWTVPIVALSITYSYYPTPPLGIHGFDMDITTPEKEEILLSPIRPNKSSKKAPMTEEDYNLSGSQTNTPGGEKSGSGGNKSFSQPPPDFDPNLLAPDKIHMELEIGPSVLKLYGALLCYLIQAKDNYLGENQAFTDFSSAISSLVMQNRVADGKKIDSNNPDESSVNGGVENKGVEKHFDPRHYRPLDVIVSVTLHDIHGHIMKACSPNDPPCPFVNLERLCLELHKTFNETRLQLLLSPLIICVENHPTVQPLDEEEIGLLYSIDGKPPDPKVLNNSAHGGHLVLSALQVRAHAMFSNCNRTLNQETLEYAWLVEIQLGDLTGRLTAAQLQNLLLALEMFTFQAEQVDSVLQPTRPYRKCQHDLPQALCPQSNVIINPHTASKNCCSVPGGNSDFFSLCPCPEDVKYRMTRLSLDEFDLCLVDNNTALELEAGPVRLSTCNLHGQDCCSGFSLVVQKVILHQYITTHNNSAHINTEATGPDTWLEAGQVSLGPITFDGATSHAINDHWIVQDKFLKVHDFKTKRLWFLWPDELNLLPKKLIGECGCIGGCSFYGSDQNQSNFFDISEKPDAGQCQFGQSNPVHSTGGKLRVCSEDDSYGFGKSLLYEGEYVFDVQGSTSTQDHVLTHPSLLQGSLTFTEGYLERSASKTPDLSPKHHSESSMGHGNSIDLVDGIFSKPVDSLNRTISTSQKEISLTENSYHGAADRSASSPLVPSVSLMSASTDSGENEVKSEILFLKPSLKGSKPEELSGNVTHWHGGGSRRSLTGLITDSSVTSTRGISPRSVRRAISTESTHSSEAYFSADEESSSSVVGDEERTTTAGSVSSSGSYPQEITGNHTYCSETFPTTRVRMSKFGNGSLERKIHPTCNRQSLEDIEEKPSFLRHSLRSNASGSSDSQTSASSSGVGGGNYDHSNVAAESNSVSSSSFISAVSSQEDVALVDLHNQMEKEIVDSPVLMSCYTTHLTHVHCHHWNTPLPLPHLFHNEPPSSSSSRLTSDRKRTSPSKEYLFRKDSSQWKPKFIHINEGFTSIKIIGRSESKTRATRSAETGVTNNSWNRRKQAKEDKDSPNTKDYFIPGSLQQHYKAKREIQDNEEVTSDRTIYRNTIVIKVEGDINATISPLMLDSLKKFLETLVPVQSTTHPLAILNHIHKLCAGHVIWQNQLKKEKVLYLCQLQNQKFNSASSIRNQHQNKLNFKVIGANKDLRDERHSITNDSESVSSTTNYEEIRTEHMQAFLDVAAINVSVLQAAIVEEVIAFSALDNVKDLTCASLFAVRLDNIFVEVSKRQHTHRALQTFAQSKGSVKDVKQRSKNDNFGVSSAWKTATRKKGKDDSLPGELVTVELKNEEEAEVAFSTKVGCIHSQLRRLKNSSSILKEAVLTVIPSRRSKVGFTFETPKILPKPPVPSDLKEENDLFPDNFGCSFSDENERFGFIMFECGLEDVTVKFLRNKQKPFALTGPNINKEKDRGSTSNPEAEHVDSANNQADGVESVSGQTSYAQGDGKGQEQDNNYKKQNAQYSQSTLAGDLSSLVVEFKTVWLNFAAPPKTPNTRKIDFTRLDWHLLSTATPSINAWLKSGNRFQEVLVTLIKTSHHRTCAVLGCLMADALDRQDIHMPVKSKFLHSKLTPLAKTLQEDPSCQLLMVLKRYLNTASSYTIEKNIQPQLVPPIKSLKRGIVALGRQWKNILYMPLLMEQNYRLRRNVPPYSVSFIAPDNDQGKSSTDDDKVSLDECEVTDETTNLLMAEGGSIFIHPTTGELYSNGVMNGAGGHDNAAALGATKSSSTPDVASAAHAHKDNQKTEDVIGGLKGHTMPSRTKKKLPSYPPRSSRASVAFPLLGGPLDSPARYTNAISKVSGLVLPSRSSHTGFGNGAKVKKNESRPSLQKSTTWSLTSIEPSNLPTSIMETPLRTTAVEDYKHNEDLYNWMARQRDDLESTKDAEFEVQALHRQLEQERLAKMFNASRVSPEQEEEDDKTSGPLFFGPIPSGLQLADAHEIFAPLFSHLGIEDASFTDSYPFNVSKKFGNKISICCFVEVLKVDIVESEYMQASSGRRKKKRQANGDIAHSTKFVFINTSLDTPAFVCNKFTLDLSLIQKLDVEATKRDTSLIQLQGDNHGTNHHGHHYHRHNFTARTSTSAATHSYLWPGSGSSPSLTTVINFTLNANYIAQQVNMPVLRLLHQFASMYQNVVETKLELKSKRARSFKSNIKDHLKKSPSAGTGSQADSSRPHSPQIPPTSSNGKSIPTGRLSMKSISGGVASLTAGITRTQSLSQKLRTTCNLKGYTNLQEALTSRTERPYSPLSLAISEAVAIDIPDSQNHSGLSGMPETSEVSIDEVDAGTDDEIRKSEEEFAHKDFHPHCWKTMYHLLKLYEFRPETKTIINRIEIKPLDVSENYKGNGKYEQLKDPGSDTVDGLSKPHDSTLKSFHRQPLISLSKGQIREISKSVYVQERVPLIAFGVIKARRVKLLATLSGLKLETELNGLNSSLTVKERTRGPNRRWSESSLTGQLGQSVVSVLEGVPPNQGVVVKMSVGKSQTLYSSLSKSGKVHNSGLLTIGPIEIDIPQHPVALHGMMTRSSRQLSTTLQELRSSRQSSRSSRQMEDLSNFPYYEHLLSPQSHHFVGSHQTGILGSAARARQAQLISPIVIQFSIIVDSLTIGAALLPSLKAQYKMGRVTSMGITGSKAKFTVDLPKHTLSFNTNIPTDANLPSSASVDLPPVHISAEYVQDNSSTSGPNHNTQQQPSGLLGGVNGPFGKVDSFTDGVVLRQGNYLSALAEIGSFEHCLTTDLLNHLVLVQKVFMKEVNEVLQKMSGGDKIAPLWNDEKAPAPSSTTIDHQRLLFSVQLRLKGIQITATTPTNSAVRLETGVVELQVSNRVQNMSVGVGTGSNYIKLFGKAQVDINLSLGQLLKNALFEEAEPEFQQFAYFKTRICMRNALQDEMISSQSEDKEAVLITLIRPLIYLQPVALDKAVLVWLNYKNAYEFWNEQRSAVNKEELLVTQQLLEKVPQISQLGAQSLGTLFLQLTVKDMGICLPLSHPSGFAGSKAYDTELKAAVVVTLESTRVSACSCQSLVSKARFTGLCIRFADDFETSLDDWKPDPMDSSIMNLCVVSEGTYEICSQTLAPQPSSIPPSNAKWILNVQWQMEGVDIHVDTNIGKQLSALFKTLTALTGEDEGNKGMNFEANFENQTSNERRNAMMKIISSGGGNANSFLDVDCMDGDSSDASEIIKRSRIRDQDVTVYQRKNSVYPENTQLVLIDPSQEAKKRSRLIEKEMNEQAKIINDLRLLGASQSTIEQEMKRLQELEAAVFNDFRRDVIKKLRRQSVKATSFKDKLGLGSRLGGTGNPSMSIFFPDVVHERPENSLTEIDYAAGDVLGSFSQDSSPSHDQTRTGSVDISDSNNISPEDKKISQREPSLDSVFAHPGAGGEAYSESSTPSHGLDGCSPSTLIAKLPESQNEHVPTSPSTLSSSENDQDYPPVVLRSRGYRGTQSSSDHNRSLLDNDVKSGSNNSKPHPIPEPSIDFELDVKVFFNSGKCVFHTKDSYKDDDQSRRGTKKERSFSGGFESSSSPSHSSKKRHGSGLKLNASSTKLRYLQSSAAGQIADFTIFLIPGLDVKVHYNSKTVIGENLSLGNKASNLKQHSGADLHVKRDGGSFFGPNLNGSVNSQSASSGNHGTEGRQQHVTFFDPPVNTSDLPTPNNKKSGVKKASLFAWMTLQSIPEEAVVSPHILDFLEQALEPIPLQITKPTPTQVPSQTTLQASEVASSGKASTMVGAATSQYAAYASFPVDVIVYFRMQPSIVRFSCLPVSRVECLLRLPSVDLVFSSKRAEDEPFPIEGTPSETPKTPGGKGAPYMRKDSVKPGSEEGVGGLSGLPSSVAGGLSMTGCLADFSLYIFHPYGGAKKPGGSSSGGSSRVGETSPLATSERKDSLSLQVEFVKVNISRSRKMNVSFENPTQHASSLNQSSSSSSTSSRASQSWSRREYGFGEDIGLTNVSFISVPAAGAVIRFSAVCDIGSASFKYDMRRLTEILAFPKAWYRRSIARRMFLGDQSSTGALYSDQDDSLETSSSSGTLSPSVGKPEFFLSSTPQTASDISSSVHTPGEKPVAHSCPTGPLSAFDQLLLMNTSSQHPSFSTHKSTAEILAQAGESQSTSTSLGSNSSSTGSGSGSSTNSSLEGPRLRDRVYSHPASLPSMGYVGQGGREGLKLHFRDTPTKHVMKEEEKMKGVLYNSDGSPMHVKGGSAWETLVLFAVSLSRLNVQMNMGNVMGNTTWLTRDFKSQGRLSIGSSGHKNLLVSVGLEGSSLDSKGGIVGGAIELSQIDTYIHLREDYGQKPDHKVALKLAALEAKLDYMGTSVLMSRVSSLDINLKDEWQINNILQAAAAKLSSAGQPHHYHHHRRKHQASSTTSDEDSENGFSKHPTKRPALIFIHGILGWDQLQLLISKSTTTDLMKMYTKLEEFFSQQFHSSKRVFSSLQTAKLQHHRSIIRRPLRPKPTEGSAPTNVNPEARHHRHWQKVLALVSGLQMNTLPTSLPAHGTILGGTMELRGNNISLACFHGINFRSKSWAIFSLREPNIVFSTEAQEIIDKDAAMNTHIVQNLSFGLGQQSLGEQGHHHHQQSNSMATVCKISRNVLFPPQFKTMQEWFHYSFSTSDLDDVNRFPVLEHERESAGGNVPAHDRRASVATSKGPELSHNQEIIFALPSLQFHLKTEHFQTQKTPTLNDPKPTVECSFVTEFDDHIFVSVDAEAFFFLHDLITSYIKEKDSSYSKTQSPDSDRRRKVADPTEALQKDWRDYVCHTWHLEPTVRLQSWAGKGFEPYGVDYILQKLGFSHARVTIPKWTQRGCMDPLDKILSVVMMRMLSAVKEEKDVTTTVSETNP